MGHPPHPPCTLHCGVNLRVRKKKGKSMLPHGARVVVVKCFFMWGITVCRVHREEADFRREGQATE